MSVLITGCNIVQLELVSCGTLTLTPSLTLTLTLTYSDTSPRQNKAFRNNPEVPLRYMEQ